MDGTTTQAELIALLAEPLGEAVAREVVTETARAMGLPERFPHKDAIRLLERVALRGGLVGITARFTMSRLHLRGTR